MKAEFRKDVRNEYMIINPADEEAARKDYRVNMLTENSINMFAPCSSEHVNGVELLYYNITGKTQLSSYLNTYRADAAFFEMLFSGIADALESVQEFLLDPDGILLDPEYIFLNDGKMYFIYYPFFDGEFSANCKSLSEKLLGSIKQDDIRAVKNGYGFYKYCALGKITVDLLREMVHEKPAYNSRNTDEFSRFGGNMAVNDEMRSSHAEEGRVCEQDDHSFLFPQQETAVKKRKSRKIFGKIFKVGEKSGGYSAVESEKNAIYSKTEYKPGGGLIINKIPDSNFEINDKHKGALKAWLLPEKGFPEDGILLDKDRYIIGRKIAGADIALESKAVSRAHAKLIWQQGIYCIVDLSSRNGTSVNGIRLCDGEKLSLKDGDRLSFADTECVYKQIKQT